MYERDIWEIFYGAKLSLENFNENLSYWALECVCLCKSRK